MPLSSCTWRLRTPPLPSEEEGGRGVDGRGEGHEAGHEAVWHQVREDRAAPLVLDGGLKGEEGETNKVSCFKDLAHLSRLVDNYLAVSRHA